MTTQNSRETGWTLIELVITLTISGLLLVMGISSYSDWIANSRVRSAATSMQQAIQLARSTAIKNNQRASFDLTNIANNKVDWAVCKNTNSGSCLAADVIDQLSSAGKMTSIQATVSSGGATCMEFSGIGRRIATARCNASGTFTIEITNPDAGACKHASGSVRCLRIQTDASGSTRMCDPALNKTTNPAGC